MSIAKNMKWFINGCIALAIMILFRYIPAPEPITATGMCVLGIFLGCIYGWCTSDMIWPSILGLIVFSFSGEMTPMAIWGFMMNQPALVIGMWLMIACGLLTNSGLADYIAAWSISRKFTEGKPWLFVSIIFWAIIICSSITGSISAILIFWAIIYSICESVGWTKGEKTPAWLVFSVVIFAITGCFLFPFQMVVITNFGFLAAGSNGAYDGSFSYGAYLCLALINQFMIYLVYILASKFIFKIDLSKLKNYKVNSTEEMKMSKKQKYGLILFVCLFVLLMAPSFLPKGTVLYQVIDKLNSVGICFLMIMIACFIRIDGKPFVTLPELASKNLRWEVIMMFGTALTLASVINSDASGIILWLKGYIGPLLGTMTPFSYVAVLMLFALVLTNLINNVVVSAILMPISWSLSLAMGVNPLAVAAIFTAFVDYAFILPSSSPNGALLYANKEWINTKTVFKYGVISLVLFYGVSAFISWPIANALM